MTTTNGSHELGPDELNILKNTRIKKIKKEYKN